MSTSLRDKVRTGLLWSAIQNWGLRVSSLFLFMVVARLLTPEQLGLFAAAAVVLNFFGMLTEQGLSEAIVQSKEINQKQLNAIFWLNISAACVVVVAVWLTASHIALALGTPELTFILQVSSLSMPVSAAAMSQTAMQRRTFGYRWIASTSLVSTVISSAVVLVMLFKGFGVWSLVAQSLTAALVVSALMWYRPVWRLTREVDFLATRPLISYGSSRLGTNLLDFANTRYIEIFLAATMGPAALAVYTVGLKLHQSLMWMFSSTILDVAHSGFSRLANDRPALIAAYYKSVTVTATLAAPIFMGIAALAPSLTVVLFGSKWISSAEVMHWMALLGAVQVLQFYNGTVYNAIGRPVINLQFMVIKVLLTFGALALARDSGMSGLLHAYLLSQLATTPMSFYLVRRLIGISLLKVLQDIWPMLCGCLALYATTVATQLGLQALALPTIFVLVTSAVVGGLTYLGFLFVVAPQVCRDVFHLIRPQPTTASTAVASPNNFH